MTHWFRRSLQGVATLGACSLLLTACSSSGSTTTTTAQVVKPAPLVTSSTVLINGKSVTVPREEYNPSVPIGSETDRGQQILITSKGVLPLDLIAPVPATLTWTNLTTKPVVVRFVALGNHSPAIPPGGSWSFTETDSISIGYVTSNGYSGQVGVGLLPVPPIPTTTTGG